ncbi:portal protein, partial [Acinetobacter baumannii]
IRRGGYRTMPYAVSRYTVQSDEVYGRSPAWDAYADIKTLNAMSRTALRYGELVTDPPWATADVDALNPLSVRPGSINPGYMNERGQMLVQSM